MAKSGKIEKYQLKPFIAELKRKDKAISCANLADLIDEHLKDQGIKDNVSAMAISRYFNRLPAAQAAIIKKDK